MTIFDRNSDTSWESPTTTETETQPAVLDEGENFAVQRTISGMPVKRLIEIQYDNFIVLSKATAVPTHYVPENGKMIRVNCPGDNCELCKMGVEKKLRYRFIVMTDRFLDRRGFDMRVGTELVVLDTSKKVTKQLTKIGRKAVRVISSRYSIVRAFEIYKAPGADKFQWPKHEALVKIMNRVDLRPPRIHYKPSTFTFRPAKRIRDVTSGCVFSGIDELAKYYKDADVKQVREFDQFGLLGQRNGIWLDGSPRYFAVDGQRLTTKQKNWIRSQYIDRPLSLYKQLCKKFTEFRVVEPVVEHLYKQYDKVLSCLDSRRDGYLLTRSEIETMVKKDDLYVAYIIMLALIKLDIVHCTGVAEKINIWSISYDNSDCVRLLNSLRPVMGKVQMRRHSMEANYREANRACRVAKEFAKDVEEKGL